MFEQDRPSIVEGTRGSSTGEPHPYLCALPATWANLWPPYYLYINNTDYPPIIQEASHSGGGFTACRGHSAPPANLNLWHRHTNYHHHTL